MRKGIYAVTGICLMILLGCSGIGRPAEAKQAVLHVVKSRPMSQAIFFETGQTLTVSNYRTDDYDLILYFDGDDCANGAVGAYHHSNVIVDGKAMVMAPFKENLVGKVLELTGKKGTKYMVEVTRVKPSTFRKLQSGDTAELEFWYWFQDN